jgi:hypothetical protein
MIYPVNYLIRQEVVQGTPYVFIVEEQMDVKWVMDPVLRFFNPLGVDVELKIQYDISQSGSFSDNYTVVDEGVATGAQRIYEFQQPLIRDGLVVHTVTYTNNDVGSDRWLYSLISGWTDIKTVLTSYVGTPVIP